MSDETRAERTMCPLLTCAAGKSRPCAGARCEWWVESFDPRIVFWFRRHAPQLVGTVQGQNGQGCARSHLGDGQQGPEGLPLLKGRKAVQFLRILADNMTDVKGGVLPPLGQRRTGMRRQSDFIAHAAFRHQQAGLDPGFRKPPFKICNHRYQRVKDELCAPPETVEERFPYA